MVKSSFLIAILVSANNYSSDSPENYEYGCIFCAAQGERTSVYDKLEHLLVHIISKHKSSRMTKEIRAKTKCFIGSDANQADDWDINIPEATPKVGGVLADELFISASKLFKQRKRLR